MHLVWTPAHKGITINEQANKLVKSQPYDTKKTHYITPEDYISIINTEMKQQMDNEWYNFPNHTDYQWLITGRHIPVMDYTDRYTTILIHRARTNSLITNSFLHKRNLKNTDRCTFCLTEQDTTIHRLDNCHRFEPVRKKILNNNNIIRHKIFKISDCLRFTPIRICIQSMITFFTVYKQTYNY
ncbi:uncharacterized protein LOC111613249 [Centruroides sculpturatus]|uniref:uncharacterized protein LOC111613249 n=1 Tax=Centruroides sculpturatus TaxID=218467 RepID=UPI000C6D65B1|nr:uncharacterized protein LOC111613249 [Centruroides sculpturatus]